MGNYIIADVPDGFNAAQRTLYAAVRSAPDPDQWMIASSGALEQYLAGDAAEYAVSLTLALTGDVATSTLPSALSDGDYLVTTYTCALGSAPNPPYDSRADRMVVTIGDENGGAALSPSDITSIAAGIAADLAANQGAAPTLSQITASISNLLAANDTDTATLLVNAFLAAIALVQSSSATLAQITSSLPACGEVQMGEADASPAISDLLVPLAGEPALNPARSGLSLALNLYDANSLIAATGAATATAVTTGAGGVAVSCPSFSWSAGYPQPSSRYTVQVVATDGTGWRQTFNLAAIAAVRVLAPGQQGGAPGGGDAC